jgi:anti-sigma regulatory factor (Ser/Thr protein kinase)
VEQRQHTVTVYDCDEELTALVTALVADGLCAGEQVLVVLTPAHRAALEAGLAQSGTDPAAVLASGRLCVLDAQRTLATFFADGVLDEAAFTAMSRQALDEAARRPGGVRVFGEMVNLLWDAGHPRAALRLEAMWNALAETYAFTLHCGYSTAALQSHPSLPELDALGRLHSCLEPPRSYTSGGGADPAAGGAADAARAFVATSAAVPAARRWVQATLLAWGEDALVPDAVLVTSELATNAVRHASSAFRARLRRDGTTVRLSFEDLARERPTVSDAAYDATGGRGVAIVEQTSLRWGLQTTADGKLVWAEFPSQAA